MAATPTSRPTRASITRASIRGRALSTSTTAARRYDPAAWAVTPVEFTPVFGPNTGVKSVPDRVFVQEPASQLLAQHNPTCDLRSYVGGQLSCHHMWSLLDADQEIPCAPTSHHITSHHITTRRTTYVRMAYGTASSYRPLMCGYRWADKPLEYHFKFRFWYQEYTAKGGKGGGPTHKSIGGGWGSNLGAGGGGLGAEFDVPKCAEGVMGCSKGADGTWVHTLVGIQKPRVGNHPRHPSPILVLVHHAACCAYVQALRWVVATQVASWSWRTSIATRRPASRSPSPTTQPAR